MHDGALFMGSFAPKVFKGFEQLLFEVCFEFVQLESVAPLYCSPH